MLGAPRNGFAGYWSVTPPPHTQNKPLTRQAVSREARLQEPRSQRSQFGDGVRVANQQGETGCTQKVVSSSTQTPRQVRYLPSSARDDNKIYILMYMAYVTRTPFLLFPQGSRIAFSSSFPRPFARCHAGGIYLLSQTPDSPPCMNPSVIIIGNENVSYSSC